MIVALYEKTGNILRPWADAGHDCIALDIQHTGCVKRDGIFYAHWDALETPEPPYEAGVFGAASPPCDHLAVSGARWFRGKGLRALARSIELFAVAAEYFENSNAAYLIENPVSTISTYWRKPDHTFHPWQYSGFELSDDYTKKTCLWAGNGFVMPEPFHGEVNPDDRIHKAAPGPERANFRSAMPMGFARAVFKANAPC
jgi:hypothetical protein